MTAWSSGDVFFLAAGLISSSLRAQDVAGQVGGEGLCDSAGRESDAGCRRSPNVFRLKLNERDADRQEYNDTHQCLAKG